jgi:spermidine synthase
VLDDPRLNLVNNDGRNSVLLAAPASYDVIVSEPPNPWISGVANLFTKDFLEVGKTRLKPGGVWSQWVQMYGMDTDDLRMLLRTVASVYDHVLVYATIEDADLVLVASDSPLVPSPENAATLWRWPKVAKELERVDVKGPMDIVAMFQMDRPAVLEMAGDGPFNTDDNMAIEYSAPLNLHLDTSTANFRLMLESSKLPQGAVPDDPDLWAHLARAYQAHDDTGRAIGAMAIAVNLLPEDDTRRDGFRAEAKQWKEQLDREVEKAQKEAEEDNG